jgi:hypothetical protein
MDRDAIDPAAEPSDSNVVTVIRLVVAFVVLLVLPMLLLGAMRPTCGGG